MGNHKVTKMMLFLLFIVTVLSQFLGSYFGTEIYFMVSSVFYIVFAAYLLCWLPFANRPALKLLMHQFEYWFKLCYLIIFCISFMIIGVVSQDDDIESYPLYRYCAQTPFLAVFTLFVMIFDAMRMKPASKMLVSTLAVWFFSWLTLSYKRMVYFPDSSRLYESAKIQIPSVLGYENPEISVVWIAANAAQVLFIFLSKQLCSSMFRPHHATVIQISPALSFQPPFAISDKRRRLCRWRAAGIAISCGMTLIAVNRFYFELSGDYFVDKPKKFVAVDCALEGIHILMFVVSTLFFLSNKTMLLRLSVVLSLFICVILVVGSWMFEWPAISPGAALLRTVVFYIYFIKARTSRQETSLNEMELRARVDSSLENEMTGLRERASTQSLGTWMYNSKSPSLRSFDLSLPLSPRAIESQTSRGQSTEM